MNQQMEWNVHFNVDSRPRERKAAPWTTCTTKVEVTLCFCLFSLITFTCGPVMLYHVRVL